MMPLRGVNKVKASIDAVKDSVNDDLRGVYLAGLSAIIKSTPVDEGRARNNWFLTHRTPSTRTTSSRSDGGTSSINSLQKMPKDVIGKKLYFTNNLPYIGVLEYGRYPIPGGSKTAGGFSKQAPKGMARINILRMAKKIRSL